VRDEPQRQGSGTVTVRNIITSLRLISELDWTEVGKRVCLADDVLGAVARVAGAAEPGLRHLEPPWWRVFSGCGCGLTTTRARIGRASCWGIGAGS